MVSLLKFQRFLFTTIVLYMIHIHSVKWLNLKRGNGYVRYDTSSFVIVIQSSMRITVTMNAIILWSFCVHDNLSFHSHFAPILRLNRFNLFGSQQFEQMKALGEEKMVKSILFTQSSLNNIRADQAKYFFLDISLF